MYERNTRNAFETTAYVLGLLVILWLVVGGMQYARGEAPVDLGCVAGCNPYDPASVDNPYGAGNPYAPTNNPYGEYRNPYGKYQNPYDSSGSIHEYAMPDGTIHEYAVEEESYPEQLRRESQERQDRYDSWDRD